MDDDLSSGDELDFSKFDNNFLQLYDIKGILGSGAGGTVFHARRRSDGTDVAVKQIHRIDIEDWEEKDGKRVPQELCILEKLGKVDGVIKMFEYFEYGNHYVVVMEKFSHSVYVDEDTCHECRMTEYTAKGFFKKLVKAYDACLDEGVLHWDISSKNILMNLENGEIRLIDFGCSAYVVDENPSPDRRRFFTKDRRFSDLRTVLFLGKLFYDILHNDRPSPVTDMDILFKDELSHECKDFLSKCLKIPSERPKLKDLLMHPFISG